MPCPRSVGTPQSPPSGSRLTLQTRSIPLSEVTPDCEYRSGPTDSILFPSTDGPVVCLHSGATPQLYVFTPPRNAPGVTKDVNALDFSICAEIMDPSSKKRVYRCVSSPISDRPVSPQEPDLLSTTIAGDICARGPASELAPIHPTARSLGSESQDGNAVDGQHRAGDSVL